jgi:hypothetical protein
MTEDAEYKRTFDPLPPIITEEGEEEYHVEELLDWKGRTSDGSTGLDGRAMIPLVTLGNRPKSYRTYCPSFSSALCLT